MTKPTHSDPRTSGTVLVTGALGNVGREVTRACVAAGFEVCVAGTREATLREKYPGLEHARLDFLDRDGWRSALAGRTYLFLLRPPAIADMKTTLNPFVDAAYAAGVEHVVFLSVAGAERMKWVPHRAVEDHLANARGSWTILRPGFFAQNFQDAYLADVVDDGRIFVPAGDGRIAFIDVFDVGDAVAALFARAEGGPHARQALTLTGPEAVTFTEATRTMSEVLGRAITYVPASVPAYAWHLRMRRQLPWMQIAVQTILHTGLRRGDAEHVDPTLPKLLGRDATPLRTYFERERARWSRGDK